jgi:microcystin-dependent protein
MRGAAKAVSTDSGGLRFGGIAEGEFLKRQGSEIVGSEVSGSEAFPVGSVFISVVNTNPATLLGYGTWAAFGAGRVLVGFNAGDADFDTAEETGGAKTHTLTAQEMPAHTHVQDAHTHVQNAHNHTQDAHSHVITSQTATTGGATSYEHGTLDTSSAETEATETTASATATNQAATAINQNATAINQNTGGGAAHNNMPPFIVAYFWKRTA